MPSFFSSLQNKAQSALDKTGLGVHLPTSHTTQASQPIPTGNPASSGPQPDAPDGRGSRPLMIDTLTQQFRALHAQYAPAGPAEVRKIQILVTNAKGIALDYEGLGRDAQAQSKDFYLWGQEHPHDDVKDVTDRLAYLSFVNGTLASQLATKLDHARNPFKELRAVETALSTRRQGRAQIESQIQKLSGDQNKAGAQQKLAELRDQLHKHQVEDQPFLNDLARSERKAIVDSETAKWGALREYGEKLALLAQAAEQILAQLPDTAPTTERPYRGSSATASIRSAVQNSLDDWKPGASTLRPLQAHQASDTRSFGESHATELSRVNSMASSVPPSGHNVPSSHSFQQSGGTQVPTGFSQPAGATGAYYSPPASEQFTPPSAPPPGHSSSAPLDPTVLNNSPAPIPSKQGSLASEVATTGHSSVAAVPIAGAAAIPVSNDPTISSTVRSDIGSPAKTQSGSVPEPAAPTVAEAGVPISAGASGPGPSKGSLSQHPATAQGEETPAYYNVGGFRQDITHESAEDEKKRLEREERERILAGGQSTYPTAEQEKEQLKDKEGSGGPPPYS